MQVKRKIISLMLIMSTILVTIVPNIFANTLDNGVYVIPIRGNIGPSMESFISSQIKKASEMNIETIVLDIDYKGAI